MDNEKNYEIIRDTFYSERHPEEDKGYIPFMNSGETYVYSRELDGKILKQIKVKFKKDGEDAEFSGCWHGHIFTEEEVAMLCSGESVTFDSVEGDMVYTVTGRLREVSEDIDPFNVSFSSTYKLFNTKEYEFVPDVFPQKFVPAVVSYGSKKVSIYHDGELLDMEFVCRELPDAAKLGRLLNGGVIEVVGEEFSESGKPAAYYGYELKKAASGYGGCVIHYSDGRFVPLNNNLGDFRLLYVRRVSETGLNVTLQYFNMPKELDYKKVAEHIFDMNYLYDTVGSDISDNELEDVVKELLRSRVQFSGVWNGHIFTPDEIGALNSGNEIEFEYFDEKGDLCSAKGALEVTGAQCNVFKDDGSTVVLDKYDIIKRRDGKLRLTDIEFPCQYYCNMEFVPDGGMSNFIPVAEEEEFESYDPDGNVPY